MGRIFLSYRRQDSRAAAGRINDRLIKEFGEDSVFLDVESIPPGANFIDFLNGEVARCSGLLAIIGEGWLEIRNESTGSRRIDDPNDYVRNEIAQALAHNIPVIPILLDNATMPKAEQLPQDIKGLSSLNALVFRHDSFRSDLDRLIRALDQLPKFQGKAFRSRRANAGLAGFLAIGLVAGIVGALLVAWLALAISNRSSGVATILLGWSGVVFVLTIRFRAQATHLSRGLRTAAIGMITSAIMLPVSLVIFTAWTDRPQASQPQMILLGLLLSATVAFGILIKRLLRPAGPS